MWNKTYHKNIGLKVVLLDTGVCAVVFFEDFGNIRAVGLTIFCKFDTIVLSISTGKAAFFFFFLKEVGAGRRRRGKENLKQAPPPAQSLMWDSISQP